jgi:hypothetical protein
MMSMLPVFWTLPGVFLSGVAAAGGIALINSVANIGGFFGASILGQLGIWSIAAILMSGCLLAASVLRNWSPNCTDSRAHDISAREQIKSRGIGDEGGDEGNV